MRLSKGFRTFGSAFTLLAFLGAAGCEEEGAAEKAGKKLDQAAEEMNESMDDMKKKLQEK